jgi:hypothetical protein
LLLIPRGHKMVSESVSSGFFARGYTDNSYLLPSLRTSFIILYDPSLACHVYVVYISKHVKQDYQNRKTCVLRSVQGTCGRQGWVLRNYEGPNSYIIFFRLWMPVLHPPSTSKCSDFKCVLIYFACSTLSPNKQLANLMPLSYCHGKDRYPF